MKPKVTIGVCVRNCEDSIAEAVESITDQDFPHELMDVIVVDGCSEDKTLEIIRAALSGKKIQYEIFFENKGLGTARQIVVDNARGKYIVWVDGDMVLPKDHVRKQVEFMEQNPRVGIAQATYGMLRGKNLVAALENIRFVAEDARAENEWKMSSKLPGTGGSIYLVEAIRKVGGFDDRLTGAEEDEDAAYRVKAAGWLLGRTSALFYAKRPETWKALWDKYLWYGYGGYCLYRKNRNIFSLYKMSPPAGFVTGLLYSVIAYRLVHQKSVFLLPFHYTFKMVAWYLGFFKSQISFRAYGVK